MTITVDCRHINSSGMGAYLQGVLPHLLESSHNFNLLAGKNALEKLQDAAGRPNARVIPCEDKPFSARELFFFPRRVKDAINSGGAYYSPFFNIPGGIKVPVFTTIHDIIFADMPQLTTPAGRAARLFFYKRAASRSKAIFTVSNFSKKRIQFHLKDAKRVRVTYAASRFAQDEGGGSLPPRAGPAVCRCPLSGGALRGGAPPARGAAENGAEAAMCTGRVCPAPANLLSAPFEAQGGRPPTKEKTIVFVGNIKKHKGLQCLLTAFRQAEEEGLSGCRLLIIGERAALRTRDKTGARGARGAADGNNIVFTGYMDDALLRGTLSRAALLVQPSLYEGFCLPPLEAMTLGTRALLSDIEVLKEIYEGFPVDFFKTGDANSLKNALLDILRGDEPPRLCLDEALKNRYNYKRTANLILDELERNA